MPLGAGAPQFFLMVAITRAFVSSHRLFSDSLWYQTSPTGICSSAGAGVSRLFWVLGPHWGPLNLPVFPPRLLTLYSKVALGKKTSVSMVEPETQFLVLGD